MTLGVESFQEGLPILEMPCETCELFGHFQVSLIETTALHEILNDGYQNGFIVIQGTVHELQVLLHELLKGCRGRHMTGSLSSIDSVRG